MEVSELTFSRSQTSNGSKGDKNENSVPKWNFCTQMEFSIPKGINFTKIYIKVCKILLKSTILAKKMVLMGPNGPKYQK